MNEEPDNSVTDSPHRVTRVAGKSTFVGITNRPELAAAYFETEHDWNPEAYAGGFQGAVAWRLGKLAQPHTHDSQLLYPDETSWSQGHTDAWYGFSFTRE